MLISNVEAATGAKIKSQRVLLKFEGHHIRRCDSVSVDSAVVDHKEQDEEGEEERRNEDEKARRRT